MNKLHERTSELRWWNANKHRRVVEPTSIWLIAGLDGEDGYREIGGTSACCPSDYYRRHALKFKEALDA
jgi:hypothetical protein